MTIGEVILVIALTLEGALMLTGSAPSGVRLLGKKPE
jgi:hypothetical protein